MSNLPTKIAKRIAGQCLYSGCHEKALDDSDYCGPHDAHERGRAANRQRRHRQKLADAGLCSAGCGRKVPRKRRPDGTVIPRRCRKCRKTHSERMREIREARGKACVTGIARGVTGDTGADDRTTRSVEADGYARTRYHGQPRRGQQPRWQLDFQDLDEAVEEIRRARRGIQLACEAEQAQTPRVQLDAIRNEAMSHAALARRFVEEVLRRNRYKDTDDEMIETGATTRG